ncbi:ABC transporter permease subunit, partial [Rhizobium ruizarguesonis]
IRFSALVSATLAFTIVMSAYSAEVFRTCIESIPRGQFEAARALGLPFGITFRKVILPQAIKLDILEADELRALGLEIDQCLGHA